MNICANCNAGFEITDEDRAFYGKIDVPEPTFCPDCRLRNRIAFRNEQKFYRRACDLCHQATLSVYSGEKPFPVYCSRCWWSDAFDPLAYGREYDENRSFFDQVGELIRAVPKPAIINMKSENCEYTNYSSENRNCYLVVGTAFSEDCYYGYRLFSCKNVVDCYDLQKSELCYECTQSRQLYNCIHCDSCENSSDMIMCNDCIACRHCFGCVNLRNKEFHIFNEPFSPKEYHEKIAELRNNWPQSRKKYESLKMNLPHKATHITHCENCTGDQLSNDKNCTHCFAVHNSEHCRHVIGADRDLYCYNTSFTDGSELIYNSMSCDTDYHLIGANLSWYTKNSCYVTNCFNSNSLFGCVGMKKHQYCILNKPYSKDEYDALSKKIIAQMRQSGEWGQYYPLALSPFAYNETVAQEYFPLTKKIVLSMGLTWKDDTDEVPSEIPASAIKCEITGKPFKRIPQEIAFYEKMGIYPPTIHPFERHRRRMQHFRAFKLYDRNCQKCGQPVSTTYSPDRPEVVYCEKCYLEAVY